MKRSLRDSLRRGRSVVASVAATVGLLVLAPAALAADGFGLYGPTTDKVIVYFAFGTMILVAVFIGVATLIQMRLDKRKEQRKEALERFEADKA